MFRTINQQIFVNLEPYLDMEEFYSFEDRIDFNISKNWKFSGNADTCPSCLYDKNLITFSRNLSNLKKIHPDLDQYQLTNLSKFSSANLGTSLFVKKVTNQNYYIKHLEKSAESTECEKDFEFLLDWIEKQKCFSEHGRIMFFINESCQKTAAHRDYSVFENKSKDMFIWLTGFNKKKRFFLIDDETGEEKENSFRACIFDNNNYHFSRGIENFRSWSLRIDGLFDKSWAEKAGIAEHFNLSN